MSIKAKKTKAKKKLTPEEASHQAAQRAFARQVRSLFAKAGYARIIEAADQEFTFQQRTSDFDDIFVRENLIVCCEHTLTKESNLGDHIKNKAHVYNMIEGNKSTFISFLFDRFPALQAAVPIHYHASELRVSIVYCSKSEVKAEHQSLAPSAKFLWYGSIRYFKSVTDTIKLSARYELNQFLGFLYAEAGDSGNLPMIGQSDSFDGSLLPEVHSNFPADYKVVSFYVSPDALLRRAYVLRKNGWKDETGLYQRMIDRDKIESIRKYLKREHRTFVNNVIITLPDETKLLDEAGNTVDAATITKTKQVKIQLPQISNCIGVVDGQHRIFSYYEDVKEDSQIAVFRKRQNMLATGILYPPKLPSAERIKFEAGLFLEINSTQNSAKSDLKQAILVLTAPYSPDSIGKRVIARLGSVGPLEGTMERHFFDKGVLKTTSIVSYGLRALVRLDGDEALITRWSDHSKPAVKKEVDLTGLTEYISFCATEINTFLGAMRAIVGLARWKVRSTDGPGILSVTTVNAFLILFRKYGKNSGLADFAHYCLAFSDLESFPFAKYHSSQYNRMAEDMLKFVSQDIAGDDSVSQIPTS